MYAFRFIVFLLLGLISCNTVSQTLPDAKSTIAFGSCADEKLDQPFWDAIIASKPDVFLFMGDNIYADTANPDTFAVKYAKLAAVQGYQELLRTTPVLATWDDHDYGINDGGKEFQGKETAKQAFLDFFGIAEDSPVRSRDGIYDSAILDLDGHRVQILLLDTRTFRDSLTRRDESISHPHPGRFIPGTDSSATLLGHEQWAWLERQLLQPAELRILVSSIQFVSEEHGWEKWGNFPHERRRLIRLIRKTRAENLVILSGDRHLAELSRIPRTDGTGVGYDLYDITSSGLNRGGGGQSDEPNRFRIGPNFRSNNFGLLHIDWGKKDPEIRFELRDDKGQVGILHSIQLSDLTFR